MLMTKKQTYRTKNIFYSSLQLKTMVRTRSQYLRMYNNEPPDRTHAEFLRLYRELDRCVERTADLTRLISEATELGRHISSTRLAEKHENIKEKKRLLLYEKDIYTRIMKFLDLSHPFVILPHHLDEELDNLTTLYRLATEDEVMSFEAMLRRPLDSSDDESNDDYDD